MIFKTMFLFYRTVRYLQPVQFRYRVYYFLRSIWRRINRFHYPYFIPIKRVPLRHENWMITEQRFNNYRFTFLNQSKKFDSKISWNFVQYGKLWAYNLNYFNYLMQSGMNKATGMEIIQKFIDAIDSNAIGLEPYPISIRNVNWIKFCLRYDIDNPKINSSLYAQYKILIDNLEYHLLGNHLLENGCSLLIGAYYFNDSLLYKVANKIVSRQLKEQILEDGAHFELSPMYHQILCHRLLDCYNLASSNDEKTKSLTKFLRQKLELMLGWLCQVTFNNGTIPKVNDSAEAIAPSTEKLLNYAQLLGLKPKFRKLNTSGYRMIKKPDYELFLDIGEMGPDYNLGHAHSDTFSFLLNVGESPIIVDTGISTYEAGERRRFERSTAAHNTVEIHNMEQSEVWNSFRVGRRAHIKNVIETNDTITGEHDGYAHLGIIHKRTFCWGQYHILLCDKIIGDKDYLSRAFIHFHPSIQVKKDNGIIQAGIVKMRFNGATGIKIEKYNYAKAFNLYEKATKLAIHFKGHLETRIML